MKSLKEFYKIGPGPSSSHTLGPKRACERVLQQYPQADFIKVILYGSLALTGKGHLTDQICMKTCHPVQCEVTFSSETCKGHPNTMDIFAYCGNQLLGKQRIYSVGGGTIQVEGEESHGAEEVYKENSFQEILSYCKDHSIYLKDYVDSVENVQQHIEQVFEKMLETTERGLHTEGYLPGTLHLKRVAAELYKKAMNEKNLLKKEKLTVTAYAYAASEENANGGETVTAPTMGASGVMPSLVRYYSVDKQVEHKKILEGLKIAGIIGNLFKTNATISGAQGGCQAEIGVACSMGSAFVAYMEDLEDDLIAYAAEIGIEHFLGLTCDPVGGYVMIPCIERNAVAALRAIDSAMLADEVGHLKKNRVSLDMIIHTMNYTGNKIAVELKETSLGGLASVVPLK